MIWAEIVSCTNSSDVLNEVIDFNGIHVPEKADVREYREVSFINLNNPPAT